MRLLFLPITAAILLLACGILLVAHPTAGARGQNHKAGEQDGEKGRSESAREEAASECVVMLRIIIRASGDVDILKVLEVRPEGLSKEEAEEFVQKSIEAARKLKFKPPTKDGRRVSQYAKLEYRYTIEREGVQK